MIEFKWKCLVCEQDMDIDYPGDEEKGCLPNFNGGDVSISFGYGSVFDQCKGWSGGNDCEYQAAICDECVVKKSELIRRVKQNTNSSFEVLKTNLTENNLAD